MTAQIIDLTDALARERRAALRIVPPHIPLASLIEGPSFATHPAHVQPIREAILFAIAHAAFAEAMAAIEEFIALPTDDDDARFCRDSLALGFCAVLQQRWADDEASDFFDRIADQLFPIFAEAR